MLRMSKVLEISINTKKKKKDLSTNHCFSISEFNIFLGETDVQGRNWVGMGGTCPPTYLPLGQALHHLALIQ